LSPHTSIERRNVRDSDGRLDLGNILGIIRTRDFVGIEETSDITTIGTAVAPEVVRGYERTSGVSQEATGVVLGEPGFP
jgi:hypothetical protein